LALALQAFIFSCCGVISLAASAAKTGKANSDRLSNKTIFFM